MQSQWDERSSAAEAGVDHTDGVFKSLFERSADAIWLYDPETAVLVDCNQAAVELIGADNKQQLLRTRPHEISPPVQPDGSRTVDKTAEIIAIVEREKRHRFEWTIRRLDGRDVPVEGTSTALLRRGKRIHVVISRDISERKKAERELLELTQALERKVSERTAALSTSEARFRALVEHAPEAIVVFDGDSGRYLFGNQHACRLYGIPMNELAELTPAEVSPEFQPDGRNSNEVSREKMAEALAGGMPVFEWSHQQQPNGRLIPTEVRLLRLPAKGQNLIRASIIDNTERKEAERALRESEAKYRALFEGSSQGVVLQDEHQFLEVNPAAVRIMGRQHANELVGKHPHELAPPEQPNGESSEAASRRHVEECMSRGSARFEWLARTAAGKDISLEVTLTRIEWSGRQIIQGFITDISERKRAQAALEESEARFSSAFEASPLIITITRLSDARFVLVNDAFVKWSGYSREEILGRDGVELRMWVQPQDRQDFWNDLLTTGSVRERECFLRDRSGKRFTMLASSELIHLNHEPHMLGMALDITQRKQAEVELLKTLERERELSQLKSNFVSMVSHEFRTPLGIIQSSAELLREFYQRMDTTEREEQLDSIGRNTRRMASMMEGILVLSRVDAGKLDFKPDRFDFTDFCRRVVEEVLSATHRRCTIELSLDSIPSQGQADERLLTHIFTNLLTNAVKYSEPGATVSFRVQRDGRDALCLVQDSGIGIPEDDQLQLFTGFHRGANVGTRPGTGLGLLMVKRCTELHGGTVLLRSRVGEGTTVTVRLPLFCAP